MANNLIYDPTYASSTTTTTPTTTTTGVPQTLENSTVQSSGTNSSDGLSKTVEENIQIMKNRVASNYDMHTRARDFNLANLRVTLKACLLFNSMDYRNCPPGYLMSVQSFTHLFTNMQMSVPYPFMGKWYLAIWKECSDLSTK